MALALGTGAILLVVLLWELVRPTLKRAVARGRLIFSLRRNACPPAGYDPGRERRAELRARALLRSCIDEHDWAMYRDLGFLRVWGGLGERGRTDRRSMGSTIVQHASYAYLIYPHKPLVAFVPQTGALLNEYCVAFPDLSRPYGSSRLPDSDDVLAKWMALIADERGLIADANMHLPGRQIDPGRVRRDLLRLARWERERPARDPRGTDRADADPRGAHLSMDPFGSDPADAADRAAAGRAYDERGADADTLPA
jgi:hypothetical protein